MVPSPSLAMVNVPAVVAVYTYAADTAKGIFTISSSGDATTVSLP